jgi:microcystin-dependent protein
MEPYIGEIRMFAGNFGPSGWMLCDGSILPISEYETLFTLIGTTYGGDGQTTFAIPDLRGRLPVHQSSNYPLGVAAGSESVTINPFTTPAHNHNLMAVNSAANSPNPGNNTLGLSTQVSMFFGDQPTQAMNTGSVTSVGGNQPHDNTMPFLCLNYIISLYGIWPSQS